MKSAVLLIAFNRPDKTRQVFAAIRVAQPRRLYVAADGPRAGRDGEGARCREVRAIASAVDWPCQLTTLFRDVNLGCKRAVSSGINWFFEHEEAGIILEDDVLPQPGFFEYCDELLDRYATDQRVAAISGCNFLGNRYRIPESYFFSRYCHIWGWATWRRSWREYDVGMAQWPAWDAAGNLERIFPDPLAASYWRNAFSAVHRGEIDTWDYQWQFSCWRRRALAAVPARNQTTNLGFDGDATHTTAAVPGFVLDSPSRPLAFPLVHPATVEREVAADRINDVHVYGFSLANRLKARAGGIARRLLRR